MKYKNIYKIQDRYHIKKTIYKKTIHYGTFKDLESALNHRNNLIKHNWKKCKTTGYPPSIQFPKYCIRKVNDGYLVINKKDGNTYGSYKNYRYATIIKKILPFYEEDINIDLIEELALKDFYNKISYNKRKDRYHVTHAGLIRSTHRRLTDALYERDLIVKYDGDEELMCEDSTKVYDYEKEELPPFPKKESNIIVRNTKKNKFQVEKQIRLHKIIIGRYPSKELAVLIKNYLQENDWNLETIKKIKKVTQNIQRRNRYIHKRHGYYYIEHNEDKRSVVYARYKDIELARFVRTKLESTRWNRKKIRKFERKFYSKSIETKFYYDKTDFFKVEKNENMI